MGKVLGIAIFIGFFAIIAGQFSAGTLLALVLFVLVGALYPPLAIGFGVVVILYLFLKRPQIAAWIDSVTKGKKAA